MPIITRKKLVYPIRSTLRTYLTQYNREHNLPIQYVDLLRYDNSAALFDNRNRDTLWETVYYPASEANEILAALKHIYAILKADGDMSVTGHLTIDRVDLCCYGKYIAVSGAGPKSGQ